MSDEIQDARDELLIAISKVCAGNALKDGNLSLATEIMLKAEALEELKNPKPKEQGGPV